MQKECVGDKTDIRSIRGWGRREPGGRPRGSIHRGISTRKGGGRLHREDAGERKRERDSKGEHRPVTSRGTRASRCRRRPGRRRRRPRADGVDPRAPGPRFAPRLPLRHPRADRRR